MPLRASSHPGSPNSPSIGWGCFVLVRDAWDFHNDVFKWKWFPRYLLVVRGFTGEFPSQRPMTRSFFVFFDLCLYKRLSKQSTRRLFETPSRSLWRHCNVCRIAPRRTAAPEWRQNPCAHVTQAILTRCKRSKFYQTTFIIRIVHPIKHGCGSDLIV